MYLPQSILYPNLLGGTMSEGTKLAEKVDLETTPEDAIPCTNSFQDCPLAFRVTSLESQDPITCSASKIGVEPMNSLKSSGVGLSRKARHVWDWTRTSISELSVQCSSLLNYIASRQQISFAECVFQVAPHAGNAPASQPWEGCELLLFEWGWLVGVVTLHLSPKAMDLQSIPLSYPAPANIWRRIRALLPLRIIDSDACY